MPQISVSVVAGISEYRTMKVKGVHGKRALFILIDSGSTHNFMDDKMAEKLGCHIKDAGMKNVAVADGRRLNVKGTKDKLQL